MNQPAESPFASNKLFQGIAPDLLSAVCAIPEPVRFAGGETIFDEDQPGDYLYLIASGVVRVSKRGRGGEQETLCFLEVADFFGEMALLDPEPRSAQATVVDRDALLGRIIATGWTNCSASLPRKFR